MFISEVLCFIVNNFDKLTTSELKPILTSFYSAEELISAKETLVQSMHDVLRDSDEPAIPRLPKRQGDQKCKQTADDILKLFTIADERKLVDMLPRFVAADLSRVPFVNAESINVLLLAKKFEILEQRFNSLEQTVAAPVMQNLVGVVHGDRSSESGETGALVLNHGPVVLVQPNSDNSEADN